MTTRPRRLGQEAELAVLTIPATPADGISDYGIADLDIERIGGGMLVETRDRAASSARSCAW